MGGAATVENPFEDYSLEGVFNEYGNVHAEAEAVPRGSARHAELAARRDELWQNYLAGGGQRLAWHFAPNDPQQEAGRSPDGPKLPIRVTERSVYVHVVRFWIGESPQQTDMWTKQDVRSLRIWQQNNHVPVTGEIDRTTYSTLIELGGEGGSVSPTKVREIATGFRGSKVGASPTILVLERKQRWMLALDNVTQRTFANQWNGAVMAALAYAGNQHVQGELDMLGQADYRDNVLITLDYPKELQEQSSRNQSHRRGLPITYGSKERVRPFVRPAATPYQFKWVEDTKTSTQCFVAWNDVHVIVSARGTEMDFEEGSQKDLFSDVQATPVPWTGNPGLVHRGFYTAFDSVREKLKAALEPALRVAKPIFVFGHSLGGAVAALIACYLRVERGKKHPIQLYTYGQPRIGDATFARNFWTPEPSFQYYRTANVLDLVTWVPSVYSAKEARDFADVGKFMLRFYYGILQGAGAAASGDLAPPPTDYAEKLYEEQRKQVAAIDKFLRDNITNSADFRHFGVLCSCGTDIDGGAFLLEVAQTANARVIEHASVSKVQRLYDSSAFGTIWHGINHTMLDGYMPHLSLFFERNSRAYLQGAKPRVPLAVPDLPHAEPRLMQRMLQLNRKNWAPPETIGGVIENMIEQWWESEQ